MKIAIVSLLLFTFSQMSFSQTVENNLFARTLESLLSNTVPLADAKNANLKNFDHILDTREANEYNVGHLKGAQLISYDSFDIDDLAGIDKEAKILVYCSVGYRSEKIGEKLIAAGFNNVRNLYGGIFEWKNLEKEVFDNQGSPTDSIHAYDKIWGSFINKGIKVYKQ